MRILHQVMLLQLGVFNRSRSPAPVSLADAFSPSNCTQPHQPILCTGGYLKMLEIDLLSHQNGGLKVCFCAILNHCDIVPKAIQRSSRYLIGHSSGSIKHRTTRFACSMEFSAMADRMVWPLSLSRDRKWPRVTKFTHSRVVGLRLAGVVINRVSKYVILLHLFVHLFAAWPVH